MSNGPAEHRKSANQLRNYRQQAHWQSAPDQKSKLTTTWQLGPHSLWKRVMSNMQTASSTYRRDGQFANRWTMAVSRRFTQKLSRIVSSVGCSKTGSESWQQCPTSRNVRLGQCCSNCVTAESVSFWDVVSSSVRRMGEQISAFSMDDWTRFAAVKQGQSRNKFVTAWSMSCGQCISQAISRFGCAMAGDTSPRSSVRSTKRRDGLLEALKNDVTH
mmetsp:Transcript_32839/g.86729  ORF Transcript_32839/g.86729 Transcript_32839/m.86729 type:complete len:216 (-) Transcript_32839:892-1539(-)